MMSIFVSLNWRFKRRPDRRSVRQSEGNQIQSRERIDTGKREEMLLIKNNYALHTRRACRLRLAVTAWEMPAGSGTWILIEIRRSRQIGYQNVASVSWSSTIYIVQRAGYYYGTTCYRIPIVYRKMFVRTALLIIFFLSLFAIYLLLFFSLFSYICCKMFGNRPFSYFLKIVFNIANIFFSLLLKEFRLGFKIDM